MQLYAFAVQYFLFQLPTPTVVWVKWYKLGHRVPQGQQRAGQRAIQHQHPQREAQLGRRAAQDEEDDERKCGTREAGICQQGPPEGAVRDGIKLVVLVAAAEAGSRRIPGGGGDGGSSGGTHWREGNKHLGLLGGRHLEFASKLAN